MWYIHTMEYYLTLKKKEFWHILKHVKWNKPTTNVQIFYDSTYYKELRLVKFIRTMNTMVAARGWRVRTIDTEF